MDKTFDEAIAGIRKAERGVEVREDIAQGMEYVKQYAEEVTGQQQAALQAAQTATGAASTATKKAAAAAESESAARTSAASAAQSEQSASADAKSAGSSAASAKAEADRAAAIVRTDKTLSVEGTPADGKAVGDALKGVISADAVKTLIADALSEDHAKIKFWISEDPTSPAALFGGTWQEIAQNRALMGASYAHAAGTTVEAGLPNITGSVVPKLTNIYNSFISESGATMTGAFYNTGVFSPYGGADATVTNSVPKDLYFDASRSNPIYGRSATVQPAAYYVHIWRRVA
jgi:hypothetical protein|nr:MAG TPA: baseplate protein [Caudoviricetes sp.]